MKPGAIRFESGYSDLPVIGKADGDEIQWKLQGTGVLTRSLAHTAYQIIGWFQAVPS